MSTISGTFATSIRHPQCNQKRGLKFNNFQVKAAGILFYHNSENELSFLFCEKKVRLRKCKEKREEKREKENNELVHKSSYSNYISNDNNKYEYRTLWEDFGGKVDEGDKSLYDTAVRETLEESNNMFCEQDLRDGLTKLPSQHFIWNVNCSYGTFLLPLREKIDTKLLGEKELHDNLERVCKWVTYKEFIQQRRDKLHIRLKTKKLLSILDQINKTKTPLVDGLRHRLKLNDFVNDVH